MPELPEVETVVRGIAPLLVGRRILRFEVRRRDLRTAIPRGLGARIEGRRVETVTRRAKYILVHLAAAAGRAAEVLLIHLGMSGRLVAGRADGTAPGRHEHVAFATEDGSEIRFSDPRRFGLVDLVRADRLATDKRFAALGPEPLSDGFDAKALAAILAGSRTSIKAALLDQARLVGVGNIYACEALFQAGISPRRRAGTVRGERAARLAAAIRDVLARAIAAGGSSAASIARSRDIGVRRK